MDSYPPMINDITLKFVVFVIIRRLFMSYTFNAYNFPYKMSEIQTRWRWDVDLSFLSQILTESCLPVVWRANRSRQILMTQRISVPRFLTDAVRESYGSEEFGRMLLQKIFRSSSVMVLVDIGWKRRMKGEVAQSCEFFSLEECVFDGVTLTKICITRSYFRRTGDGNPELTGVWYRTRMIDLTAETVDSWLLLSLRRRKVYPIFCSWN